jgi:hypothetical protein
MRLTNKKLRETIRPGMSLAEISFQVAGGLYLRVVVSGAVCHDSNGSRG